MDRVVSLSQLGFIPRRNIHENLVLAEEILHNMHKRQGGNGFFAIKVDLDKAYDNISWNFVDKVLVKVGIPSKLCDLIMGAITFVKNESVMEWRNDITLTLRKV